MKIRLTQPQVELELGLSLAITHQKDLKLDTGFEQLGDMFEGDYTDPGAGRFLLMSMVC